MELDLVPKPATCVWCEAVRPEQGKLLSCLHVACPSCLRDVPTMDRSVKCPVCWEITACPPGHRSLQPLLEDAAPLLYNADDAESGSSKPPAPPAPPQPRQERKTCEFCEEQAAETATHSCRFCVPAALLCDGHAQRHAKSRRFQEHVVIRLAQRGGSSAETTSPPPPEPLPLCPVHAERPVNAYCHTCRVLLCDTCRPALHTAHRVLAVAEAAAATREQVRCALASASAGACTPSPSPPRGRSGSDEVSLSPLAAPTPARRSVSVGKRPAAAAATTTAANLDGILVLRKNVVGSLRELSRAVESVGEEAAAASEQVCVQVGRVEQLLAAKRAELLRRVERRSWRQRQALEERSTRLRATQQQLVVAESLGAAVLRPDVRDVTVLRLGGSVVGRLDACRAALAAALSRGRPQLPPPPLSGGVDAAALGRIEALIAELAYVDGAVDLHRCRLKLPARARVGVQWRAALRLYAANGAPLSLACDFAAVSAHLEPPSGRSRAAALIPLPSAVPTATLEMTCCVEEAGVHWVLIGNGQGALVKTSFHVLERASQNFPERKQKM